MRAILSCFWVWDVRAQTSLVSKREQTRAYKSAKQAQELTEPMASFLVSRGISMALGKSPDTWAGKRPDLGSPNRIRSRGLLTSLPFSPLTQAHGKDPWEVRVSLEREGSLTLQNEAI